MVDVHLAAELHSLFKGIALLAEEDALIHILSVVLIHDRQQEGDGQDIQHILLGVVKQAARRSVHLAHDAVTTVEHAEEVADVDHLTAAAAHHQILGVPGKTGDLVGDHLANGEDRVILSAEQLTVDSYRNVILEQAFGHLVQKRAGHRAHHFNGLPEVMNKVSIHGDPVSEHLP